jgi:hypothetical protein
MSDELRKDEEHEVEGHVHKGVASEPVAEEEDDEVEAHVRKAKPSHI